MTYDYLESEQAFEKFVREFGTLPRSSWTHAAHLSIGAWYLLSLPEKTVIDRIRNGIRHYNECVGVANTVDSGYHETLTRFWVGQVSGLLLTSRRLVPRGTLEAIRDVVVTFAPQRDLFKQYYTFDVVASREARARWIPPDRIV